jgi:phosphoribosylaminoimidazole-succinocarboxamide synthase
MADNRTPLYEGKAKRLFQGDEAGTIIQYFKDDATAFNAQKKDIIIGKGILNNLISAHLFPALGELGIPHHFIARTSPREQLVKSVEIIPIEVIIRNIAAGSICPRHGLTEGEKLDNTLIEFCLKNDALGDPVVAAEHILTLGIASPDDLVEITEMSFRINDFLSGLFFGLGVRLVDFKLEFGWLETAEGRQIVLADELSPDNCRLWDIKTDEKLDKDRFRRDIGGLIEAYSDIATRLGLEIPPLTPQA